MSHSNGSHPSLLIVDDDPLIAETLGFYLEQDFRVTVVGDRGQAMQWVKAQTQPPELALVDLGLPPAPHRPEEGFALISELVASAPRIRIVVLHETAHYFGAGEQDMHRFGLN
jgi:two-component system nitrogen regulation response regulator GlnG